MFSDAEPFHLLLLPLFEVFPILSPPYLDAIALIVSYKPIPHLIRLAKKMP